MNCCVTDLRCKEVICRSDGERLGFVGEVEVDTCTGRVAAILIFGPPKYFGCFGPRERIRVCWEEIDVIGPDTILVSHARREPRPPGRPRR
ncbi:MAG: YlmC/YmxH family sporulation protein [Clostridia bacterium]|nr:YlmC/YmxH family sporulation protein [Clostridia bacterium]